jgi:hypothetical protein
MMRVPKMIHMKSRYQGGAKEESKGIKALGGVTTIAPGNNGSFPFL